MKTEEVDLSTLTIDRSRDHLPKRRRAPAWLWVVLLALAGLAIWLARSWETAGIGVQVATVAALSAASASPVLNASGYVVAQRQADVASKATGRLVALYVGPGDRVTSGQMIARIESADMAARLAEARANVAVAKAALVQAKAADDEARLDHDRKRRLLDAQLISSSEFEIVEARRIRAQAGVVSAEAVIAAAEAAARSAEVELANTDIRAPFDGTVLTKNADVGEIVAPMGSSATSKAAVVRIADMTSLLVEADVSERNLDQVRIGAPCEITLDAFPDTRYRGVVETIVPTADRAKATVLTKIRFVDRDARVLPEMSAKVAFLSAPRAASDAPAALRLAVPGGAIVSRDGRSAVFVVRDARAIETPIETGAAANGLVEVLGGIAAGDRVVVNPPASLQNGDRVERHQ
ncbi:MAG: hypothetical protein A2638_06015 [Nitrospirae bacterium RIFCSPHIGHO2_01_FULL_66_17]|nr:MAG: hypothetical protein A2638_06015 [Nitrospirae bacterium RIFCSPHIGHO2_01_FULL_66_17]